MWLRHYGCWLWSIDLWALLLAFCGKPTMFLAYLFVLQTWCRRCEGWLYSVCCGGGEGGEARISRPWTVCYLYLAYSIAFRALPIVLLQCSSLCLPRLVGRTSWESWWIYFYDHSTVEVIEIFPCLAHGLRVLERQRWVTHKRGLRDNNVFTILAFWHFWAWRGARRRHDSEWR